MITRLTRLGRIGKLFKIVRLTRMIRLVRFVYAKNRIMKYVYNAFKIGVAVQRLLYLLVLFCMFWHITACLWIFAART